MARAKVLIIDDNNEDRADLKGVLEWAGYQVEESRLGAQALQCLRGDEPEVIILSLQLPDMDGLALLRTIREGGYRTPVIMISQPQRAAVGLSALEQGAGDFLEKPFDPRRLLEALRVCQAQRTKGLPSRMGRYDITGVLAKGGMGQVYRGWDPDIRRSVAIKVLDLASLSSRRERLELETRFMREAQVYGALSHPNVVPLYDFGKEGSRNVLFLVLGLIDGPSLRHQLEQQGPMPPRRALDVALQILRALAYAHSVGVIHRDVKPGNILLAADGRACLTDFGVAKISGSTITAQNIVLGTLPYLSPEQVQGQLLDDRSDQFSLGVVLYESLTGIHPFSAPGRENVDEMAKRIIKYPHADPRMYRAHLPEALVTLLRKMLAKGQKDRFQSDTELEAAVREVYDRLLFGIS